VIKAVIFNARPAVRLGLRENVAQFTLLVIINAFVGAMVGMERSILPAIAEQDFHLVARTAVLSFIVVFGVTKAITNYAAGRLADRVGRKQVLVAGWAIAIPVPFILMWAPSWNWILVANALLGISQGFTWSTTVIMKIDLVGNERRGLAMGLNEFAGYLAVAGAALLTGWISARHGLRPDPFYPGVVFVAVGLALSALMVRETHAHVAFESSLHRAPAEVVTPREVFWRTTWTDRNLSSISQAGLVNNLNDGMAWGLFPLFFAAANLSLDRIGMLAAIYPATWGVVQLATGALSNRVGRKWLIATGMWVQAAGISVVILSRGFVGFAAGGVLLGIGTAMVYPTLLAAIGDVAAPAWRASSVGVYRLWRDLGYALGALLAGITADVLGLAGAMWVMRRSPVHPVSSPRSVCARPCSTERCDQIHIRQQRGGVRWLFRLAISLPISRPKQPRVGSVSTSGWGPPGPCCSRIRKTSPRFAQRNSATSRSSSPSLTSGIPRSSG
jgi:MFS family permease